MLFLRLGSSLVFVRAITVVKNAEGWREGEASKRLMEREKGRIRGSRKGGKEERFS